MDEYRKLDHQVAIALGYTMYHYDKDVKERCYWMLMTPTFEPAALGWHDGERRTEAEAWMDCPHFCRDIAIAWCTLEEHFPWPQYMTSVYRIPSGLWRCYIERREDLVWAQGANHEAAAAISRAILNASEWKEQG